MKFAGGIRLARRAPTIAPAEVPTIRSAPDKSTLFSISPAITPDSQASPTGPPPPRISARSLVSLLLPAVRTQIKRREARIRTATDTDFLAQILSGAFKSIIDTEPRCETSYPLSRHAARHPPPSLLQTVIPVL